MAELQELLTEELRDLYDAEKQLTKALPKVARSIQNGEIKQSFVDHLEVTKNQVSRIEQCLELLGERVKSKPCRAMKGLVEEAQEHLQEHEKGPMLDAVLIGAGRKVEHYEIAGYMTARDVAKALGLREVAGLLQDTLREEEQQDKALAALGARLLKEMARARPVTEPEQNGGGGRSRSGGTNVAKKSAVQKGARSQSASQQGSRGTSSASTSRNASPSRRDASASRSPTRSARGAARSAPARRGSSAHSRGAALSQTTTDHDLIREWAEERGAKPACVRGTGGKGDAGMIRLDFPGYSGEESLQQISWDEFFKKFEDENLALVLQEHTAGGQKSNFNKLIARQSSQQSSKGGRPNSRRAR